MQADEGCTREALILMSAACWHLVRDTDTDMEHAALEAANQLDLVAGIDGLDARIAGMVREMAARCRGLSGTCQERI